MALWLILTPQRAFGFLALSDHWSSTDWLHKTFPPQASLVDIVLPPVEDAKYAVITFPLKVKMAGWPEFVLAELTASFQLLLSFEAPT